jgi:hypothetical protein
MVKYTVTVNPSTNTIVYSTPHQDSSLYAPDNNTEFWTPGHGWVHPDDVEVTRDGRQQIQITLKEACVPFYWSNIRSQRNQKLLDSDWTQLTDIADDIKGKWTAYRQALRDITLTAANPVDIIWPKAPDDPKPYPSWIWNETEKVWVPPRPPPRTQDGDKHTPYIWDELLRMWVSVDSPTPPA